MIPSFFDNIAVFVFFLFFLICVVLYIFSYFYGIHGLSLLLGEKNLKKYMFVYTLKKFIESISFSLAIFFIALYLFTVWSDKDNIIDNSRKNMEILFILDISRSSLTDDMNGFTRLDYAKGFIKKVVNNFHDTSFALSVFKGKSELVIPPIYDKALFLDMLRGVDTEIISVGGTNIVDAVNDSVGFFTKNTLKNKVLILLSDGEEDVNDNNLKSPKSKYFFISAGLGGDEEVPLNINGQYIKDIYGNIVKTKQESWYLESIAKKFKGVYFNINHNGEEKKLISYLRSIEDGSSKKDSQSNNYYNDYILISLIFFMIYILNYIFRIKNLL